MSRLDVIAKLTIREGKLSGFKQQAAEIIRLVKEKDTKTLRYDWYLSNDGTECEVFEAYESSEGLIEHVMHIREARAKLFEEFADNHRIVVYGNPSPQFVEMANAEMAGRVKWFSFLQGL